MRASNSADLETAQTGFADGSSVLDGLSTEQGERLARVLDDYLSRLDEGLPPSAQKLINENPDLAEPLASYLDQLEALHDVAVGFSPGTDSRHDAALEPDGAEQSERPDQQRSGHDERRIGDFVLGKEIGRGGMGVVYEARQISLDRRVALKLLPFAAVLNAKQIARFKNEAQAAAQIQHPNIVPVFAVGAERGVHYYAMRLIDGQPLDAIIAELRLDAQLDKPQACPAGSTRTTLLTQIDRSQSEYFRLVAKLGVQAANALHAAHEYGVIHRDIKPSNLLLDDAGKLWVTDFGLARCQSQRDLTHTGEVIGTTRYMSPEQASGKTALVDHRTDVYALGVTLYELVTLEAAFPEPTASDAVRSVETWDPVDPRRLNRDIPVDLENVILKAISRDREHRYETAADFAADLQNFLDNRPTIAKPLTLYDRARRWVARHQTAVLVSAAVAGLLLLTLSVSMLLVARAGNVAMNERELAEHNYQQALEFVQFGDRLSEDLAKVPGAEALRHELQGRQLKFYQQIAKEPARRDFASRVGVARTHTKIGAIHKDMGDVNSAIASLRMGLADLQSLLQTAPEDPQVGRDIALTQNSLAMVMAEAGRIDAAFECLNDAVATQRDLIGRYPDRDEYRSDLVLSQVNLGLLYQRRNNTDAAVTALAEAVESQLALLERDPDNMQYLRQIATTYNNLGGVLNDDQAAAIDNFEKSIEYYRRLVDLAETPSDYNSLATTLNNVAGCRSRAGQHAAAVNAYDAAISAHLKLVADYPLNQQYRSDLARSYNNLAMAEVQHPQRSTRVVETFKQALAVQKQLIHQNPTNVHHHSTLGSIYGNLGTVLEGRNQMTEAAKAYSLAIDHQQAALDAAPHNPEIRDYLSRHLFRRASVLRQLGLADDAVELTLRRKQLWPTEPDKLYNVSRELALTARQMTPRSGPDVQSVHDQAIATLEDAFAAGWEPQPGWQEAFTGLGRARQLAALAAGHQQRRPHRSRHLDPGPTFDAPESVPFNSGLNQDGGK